jgi:hypothetical protein
MFHIHLLLLPAGGELVSLGHRLLSLFSETIQIHDKPSGIPNGFGMIGWFGNVPQDRSAP